VFPEYNILRFSRDSERAEAETRTAPRLTRASRRRSDCKARINHRMNLVF